MKKKKSKDEVEAQISEVMSMMAQRSVEARRQRKLGLVLSAGESQVERGLASPNGVESQNITATADKEWLTRANLEDALAKQAARLNREAPSKARLRETIEAASKLYGWDKPVQPKGICLVGLVSKLTSSDENKQ